MPLSAEELKNINGKKVPKWESRLWTYVSNGDGVNCPVYNLCHFRQGGGWCVSDEIECVQKLPDNRQFNPSDFDFLSNVELCEIFKLVEILAQSILREEGISCPPVPSELVSMADDQYPVEVRLVPLKCYHGAIWFLKDSWVIHLNKNDSPSSRRLTLFHEAFHILAHTRANPVFRKRNVNLGSFNELLAECFAAAILMPRKWVEVKLAEGNNVHQMAKIFDVTERAIWCRLKVLHLGDNFSPP